MTLKAVAFAGAISGPAATVNGIQSATVLALSAIPFISPSSGNMGNNGAVTALTALPTTYANAYVWFTANQIAVGVAAGWYFAQFSTTQACTVFNNTYTSGKPTIPASPTAFVTTGPGAFTGDTAEEFGPTITVPAGAMGANGAMGARSLWGASPSNANAKTPRLRFSGQAGTITQATSLASQLSANFDTYFQNRGVQNAQIFAPSSVVGPGINGNNNQYGSIDTSVATTLVLSMQKAVATDNMVLESFVFELFYGA